MPGSHIYTHHEPSNVAMKDHILVIALLSQLHKVPHRLWRILGLQLHAEIANVCRDAGVSFRLDAPGPEHVLFVGENGSLIGGVRGEAGACEGGGCFACRVDSGVVRQGFRSGGDGGRLGTV